MSIDVDIKKTLGNFTLHVQFEAKNEIMGLLGASGCGKSMTLKCIAGIVKPDSGRIVINDHVVFDSAKNINLMPQQRRTGYLFQNYALFPHMTVAENIAVGIRRPAGEKKALVEEKMAAFYLAGLENRYPGQISGGQQQRVALARIFASQPEIIMLDEPFSALDSHLKWQIELETMKVLEKYQGTILLVSHSRDEVYRLCERAAVIAEGQIDGISAKRDLFDAPQTLAASKLTGCKNHSRAEKIDAHTLRAIDWNCFLASALPVPDDLKYVGIRAHYLALTTTTEKSNRMDCEVVRVIEDTFNMMVVVRPLRSTGRGSEVIWQTEKAGWQVFYSGQEKLCLRLPEDKLLLLR